MVLLLSLLLFGLRGEGESLICTFAVFYSRMNKERL